MPVDVPAALPESEIEPSTVFTLDPEASTMLPESVTLSPAMPLKPVLPLNVTAPVVPVMDTIRLSVNVFALLLANVRLSPAPLDERLMVLYVPAVTVTTLLDEKLTPDTGPVGPHAPALSVNV